MVAERLIIGLLMLIMGAFFCFAGYRLFRVIMAIWSFLLGFFVGIQITSSLLNAGPLTIPLTWGTGILLGLILAVLAYALYTAAMILLGASIGYILGTGLMTVLGIANQMALVIIVGLILAVLFAILVMALDLARVLIVATTAVGGAASIVIGILMLYQPLTIDFPEFAQLIAFFKDAPGWLLLWLALAIVGGLFQLRNTRRYQLEKYVLARKATHS
ncbi:MAG TPA: DUF4203 domain-containing protein [Ktedonobacteraceae bacterium]